jgi:creatinine amidohydrolase
MRLPNALVGAVILLSLPTITRSAGQDRPPASADRGQRLEDLAWPEAERVLTPDTVVVVPIGAASKEHGPHLKLRSDLTLAEYLTRRVLESSSVVVAPTLTYHHYPAFVEYPGSTTLSLDTAREMTADVIRSLARYGPRRFYVLNTGISTVRPLALAANALADEGILARFTDMNARLEAAARGIVEQQGGSHADEVETSMMLYIDPSSVDMKKAVKDYAPSTGALRLTRERGGKGTYSPTGIWGDPTLATRDKGRMFVEALVAGILDDIKQLRSSALPTRTETPPADRPAPPPAGRPASASAVEGPPRCSAGDERTIRGLGDAFAAYWANADSLRLGGLWSESGDVIHTDGSIERGPIVITQNRAALFGRREYRNSRHPMFLMMIRCLSLDIAVADGRWELRGVLDTSGKPLPTMEGQVTLVVKRAGDSWKIESYRYTVKAPPDQKPTTLKRPGSSG